MTKREIIGYSVIFVSMIPIIIARFINIDKTETRLFVDYWYLVALPLLAILLGGMILRGKQ